MQPLFPILEQLAQIYDRMDAAYRETAQAYSFTCTGCEENCCRSRFYHHTLIEHLMLQFGLDGLPIEQRKQVTRRARDLQHQDTPDGRLCPLNEAERCILYAQRPMICRLHGIPHQLRLPDGRFHTGPGCPECERQITSETPRRLDRTLFYHAIAGLEQEARRIAGWSGKRRMTIAQMILTHPTGHPEGLQQPGGE